MSYDVLRRLATWQNVPGTSPSQKDTSVYDGEGQRIQQIVTNSGTTTTTNYIQGIEEIATTGSTTTTTKYYNAGLVQAIAVNGSVTYLVPDALGSISEDLDASGNVLAEQLFGPYGNVRYSVGSMPGSHGYTGQVQDASGLAYFNARYYDPVVGQFTSADTVQGPNRYGYVAGNPETLTDPSGHLICCGGYAPPPPPPTVNGCGGHLTPCGTTNPPGPPVTGNPTTEQTPPTVPGCGGIPTDGNVESCGSGSVGVLGQEFSGAATIVAGGIMGLQYLIDDLKYLKKDIVDSTYGKWDHIYLFGSLTMGTLAGALAAGPLGAIAGIVIGAIASIGGAAIDLALNSEQSDLDSKLDWIIAKMQSDHDYFAAHAGNYPHLVTMLRESNITQSGPANTVSTTVADFIPFLGSRDVAILTTANLPGFNYYGGFNVFYYD